jgi:hypothetical protein
VNSATVAKIVVIIVALAGFMVWRSAERHQQGRCDVDCPTDLSAAKRN